MNYIDLGLPSGTLWADENAEGYYTFDKAKEKFGESLPSKELWQELIDNCEWLWDFKNNQMVVIGKNGNRIVLPACGFQHIHNVFDNGTIGFYWSSDYFTDYIDCAYHISFSARDVGISNSIGSSYRHSVRQIKK